MIAEPAGSFLKAVSWFDKKYPPVAATRMIMPAD